MWQNLENFDKAQMYFAKSVKVQESMSDYDKLGLAYTCQNLGMVWENKGEFRKAEKIYL